MQGSTNDPVLRRLFDQLMSMLRNSSVFNPEWRFRLLQGLLQSPPGVLSPLLFLGWLIESTPKPLIEYSSLMESFFHPTFHFLQSVSDHPSFKQAST